MAPSELQYFAPKANLRWLVVDKEWFQTLSLMTEFTASEKVHLARLAIQQQWICDVRNLASTRARLAQLGLHFVPVNQKFLVASGSSAFAEYLEFRNSRLSIIDKGMLYGFPSTAVLAFSRLLPLSPSQSPPETCAAYYLGGAYSADHTTREREFLEHQWIELNGHAPDICAQAESAFRLNYGGNVVSNSNEFAA